ncbi:hypothetical protein BDBG_16302 [Blastomyces gilchristii SLH14081]|uniref:Uncharacterized protein n=1 Tax=Blastomyces gilchristii (strain SLH14081) TaxID=559298 RepID=A0A179U9X0_BLAGS|nr:uncharacterized protein BDBG_16302 [Blastomyces gilchristii SLH14081]OAT04650.1 hypothetical protein BDBG_16302 [Blastomyces gilchristii SLH14081]
MAINTSQVLKLGMNEKIGFVVFFFFFFFPPSFVFASFVFDSLQPPTHNVSAIFPLIPVKLRCGNILSYGQENLKSFESGWLPTHLQTKLGSFPPALRALPHYWCKRSNSEDFVKSRLWKWSEESGTPKKIKISFECNDAKQNTNQQLTRHASSL